MLCPRSRRRCWDPDDPAVRPAPSGRCWLVDHHELLPGDGGASAGDRENAARSDGGCKPDRYAVLNGATGYSEDPTKPHYDPVGDAPCRGWSTQRSFASTKGFALLAGSAGLLEDQVTFRPAQTTAFRAARANSRRVSAVRRGCRTPVKAPKRSSGPVPGQAVGIVAPLPRLAQVGQARARARRSCVKAPTTSHVHRPACSG